MNDAQASPANQTSTGQAPKPRRLFPSLWWWIVVALAVTAALVLQATNLLDDQGITNLVSISLCILSVLILLAWFFFLSGYSRGLRLVSGLVLVLVLGTFGYLFPLKGFTGNMLPIFGNRLAERAEPPAAAGAAADLASTTPDDFWQFLGPNRNTTVENVKLNRDWSAHPPKLLWRQPIGEGWSAFAVVNGYAVTLEQRDDLEMITCYELKTGKPIWSHSHQARYATILGGVGPRSTPTIHDGKVYALGATGILFCLDGNTGQELWKKDLLQEFGITPSDESSRLAFGRANSPLIVDDLVIVPAGNNVSLVAYHKDTGDRVWTGGNQPISYSSPVLATLGGVEQILIVNEASVSGHDPTDGKVLWQFKWDGRSSEDANASQAVPVDPDRVFVSKGYQQGSALYHLVKKNDDTFDPKRLWHNKKSLRTKFTNVSIKDGFAYGLSDGLALECVELASGKSQWKQRGFGHGQILRVGDLLLVLAEDGELFLFEASPEAPHPLGSVRALEGVTWNNLALYGRYLLVRNAREAACYELPIEE